MRSYLVGLAVLAATAAGMSEVRAQGEPTGSHPRLFLGPETVTALQALQSNPDSAVSKSIRRCADVRDNPGEYQTDYQGLDFGLTMASCALSWHVTGNAEDAATAIQYFHALLDDYATLGDGAGGDDAVQHDSGYAMRGFGVYAALAYDWLHDAPGVDDALLAHARARFKAWSDWYALPDGGGYLPEEVGANYHAGYMFGDTLMAIAQGGEAGTDGAALWRHVVDDIWNDEMTRGVQPGGVLDGGEWHEGWQYGPLSVAEYALGVRAMRENNADLTPLFDDWTSSLVVRQHYARTPQDGRIFIGGDSDCPECIDHSTVYRIPNQLTMASVLAGHAAPEAKAWARAEIASYPSEDESFLWVLALGEAEAGPTTPFPTDAPTWYLVPGASRLFARTDWSEQAVWWIWNCGPHRVADHGFYDAGNLAGLSRGADPLVVDPTPYGSLSTLTGNAPAISSSVLPEDYRPSQSSWGESGPVKVGYDWARQTRTGVAAGRCQYAGTFQFREEPPPMAYATRDFIAVPYAQNSAAATIVIDRAQIETAPLFLRFRTLGALSLSGDIARQVKGSSSLTIQRVYSSGGSPSVQAMPVGDCYSSSRGGCEASILAGDEYKIDVDAQTAVAIHVLDAAAADATLPPATVSEQGAVRVVSMDRGGKTIHIALTAAPAAPAGGGTLTYSARAIEGAVHIVPDAPRGSTGRSDVTATLDGENCTVTVTAHDGDGGFDGKPLVLLVDPSCAVTEDPTQDGFQLPDPEDRPDGGPGGHDDTDTVDGGCGCQTGGAGAGALGIGLLVAAAAFVLRPRRR